MKDSYLSPVDFMFEKGGGWSYFWAIKWPEFFVSLSRISEQKSTDVPLSLSLCIYCCCRLQEMKHFNQEGTLKPLSITLLLCHAPLSHGPLQLFVFAIVLLHTWLWARSWMP